MRYLEIGILILLLIDLIGLRLPVLRKRKAFLFIPFQFLLLIPLHLIIEGYRWQMVPSFILAVLLIATHGVLLWVEADSPYLIKIKWLRMITAALSFAIYLSVIIFPVLLPVNDLPKPTGEYAVGSISYRLIDPDREEEFTENPDDRRELLVTAWYPAEGNTTKTVLPYWDRGGIIGKAYSLNSGMGSYWYSHLNRIRTNSLKNAPPVRGDSFPVLIYSPSFYGLNNENTILMEELASHGFVVFSIAHSYETIISLFPDGEAIEGDLGFLLKKYDSHGDLEDKYYKRFNESLDEIEKWQLVKKILTVDEESSALLRIRSEDVLFLLDQIKEISVSDALLKGVPDHGRIGVFGWSFGGATAMEASIADNRIAAGVNIDGWPYGDGFNSERPLKQPFMIIKGAEYDEVESIVTTMLFERSESSKYLISIHDAWHLNFWDFPWFFPIYKFIDFWGPIDAEKMNKITATYIRDFFNIHLKGMNSENLNQEISQWTEVSVKIE